MNFTRIHSLLLALSFILFAVSSGFTREETDGLYPALGAPAERKVDIAWNRYHDTEGLESILRSLHDAFPTLTRIYSIGKSYEGRDLWCLEVTNHSKGDADRKPAMYIDGNIHGNEVQAGEVVAYTAWYLCENYGRVDQITDLLDKRVFYLIPTINPDGRDYWFHAPNTMHSSRTGHKPIDEDRDGLTDEDPFDDLDGDGSITMMRRRDPNGRWKADPDYPDYFMDRVDSDERGEYELLGPEGIDNDGDGRVNEDPPGGYDPNRNWAWDWQPGYVQYWSRDYPFSLPSIRAVADFVIGHPNIGAAQSYHNFGGYILRGPNREGGEIQPGDERVMAAIGERGERMLPFYRSVVSWSGLYPVWGGETDWFYCGRGITAFTNELWTLRNMFRNDEESEKAQGDFLKYLLQEQGLTKWKEYDHPQYGKIEIGGMRQQFYRTPPSFMLEEECHRNMAFTLYHASQTPLIEFGDVTVERIGDNLHKVWVEIRNDGMIPTRLDQDVRHQITRADEATLSGVGLTVLSSGVVTDPDFKRVTPVEARPERVLIDSIEGLGAARVQFIVSGHGKARLVVDSIKGGRIERDVNLP
ncbi:MAG: peptidase M14 [bacterium]|nr:peptidase M14 [bacterium]